ncbi:MAG: tRNA (adenosine(37)-N6)-threonylcarbamoyltransferase complex transferase subunit TsaD [Candidatus Staskawiczbacteria bacterium]|nr:tRNA (adenosine(37)-N6)-threonylcarbamoyltransferase complex transferase subunit TsaD [Candidatus Staskawiczbacteria bacterium]
MKILAIETSCDDTAVAALEIKEKASLSFDVLSNIVSSQAGVHKKYGGVFPAMAKREHQNNLVPVLTRALKQAKLLNPKFQIPRLRQGFGGQANPKKIINPKFQIISTILEREQELCKKLIPFFKKYENPDVDLIAVTHGPGLEPCLWVGINFAKAIAYFWDIPIVPVNHIESHLLVNILENKNIKFPAICLVVSGGHTQLILMKGIGKYKILGETRDDAAGECFDKCAKILGLGYPGGPIISKLADRHPMSIKRLDRHRVSIKLPRPMINTKDYDFSFSGLKTAVLYAVKERKRVWSNSHDRRNLTTLKFKQYQQEMAVEIQQAIIDVLIKKTIKASKDYKAKTIILGGGVSANKELRLQFESKIKNSESKINFLVPPKNLSTDNAVMTAVAGYFNRKNKIGRAVLRKLKAEANLRIHPVK